MSLRSRPTRRSFLVSSTTLAAAAVTPRALARTVGVAMAAEGTKPLPEWKGKPVLDLSRSKYAKLHQVPVDAVEITGFWAARRRTNVESSIPSMHDELVAHGRMTNFQRLAGKSATPQTGPLYSDSDVYKWIEAAAFALQSEKLPALRQTVEGMVRDVVAVQEPGGYLNTYFVADRKPQRMLQHTQEVGHELYCMGHFLQGAIALYRATGDAIMLNAGIRFVDDFLLPNYGPGVAQKPIVSGHPEIEMALIELSRTTGNPRYTELAGYILHGDTRWTISPRQIRYMFCGVPFVSRTKLEGHAVRAMYACCGATDYFLETGDPAYLATLERLWADLSEHQMYVTGGVGARSEGEAFGEPYELPNAQAYGESCAAIGNMMWNARMLAATGEARFTDVMERALYNGINSGMSLDGRTYCYRNPLAFDPASGETIRNPWYDTTCCPPNLERTFASLPGYFYSTSSDGLYVHLYDTNRMSWKLEDGMPLTVTQQTDFPWNGDVQLTVSPAQAQVFTVFLRVPGWSAQTRVAVNGKAVDGARAGQYLAVRRRWTAGDRVSLTFDMTPRAVQANPSVAEDLGRVCVQRGPLVYCMESLDQSPGNAGRALSTFRAARTGEATIHAQADLLGGVTVIEYPGFTRPEDQAALYQAVSPAKQAAARATPTTLRLIPYYAWNNRTPAPMQVWIPWEEA